MDVRYLPFYGGLYGGSLQPALYSHLNGGYPFNWYGPGHGGYGGCCGVYGGYGPGYGIGGYRGYDTGYGTGYGMDGYGYGYPFGIYGAYGY